MKRNTKQRKVSASHFQELLGEDNFTLKVAQTISWGKKSIDSFNHEIGKMLVESIMLMDCENIAGPDYAPEGGSLKMGTSARLGVHRRSEGQSFKAAPAWSQW